MCPSRRSGLPDRAAAARGDALSFTSTETFPYIHLPGSLCFEGGIKARISTAVKDKTQWGSRSALQEE